MIRVTLAAVDVFGTGGEGAGFDAVAAAAVAGITVTMVRMVRE